MVIKMDSVKTVKEKDTGAMADTGETVETVEMVRES